MAVLTSKKRNSLPNSAFALPGRRYPIHDEAHARDALARGAANLPPDELATLKSKIRRMYPGMKVT